MKEKKEKYVRPRERKFFKISNEWLCEALKDLDPESKGKCSIVYKLGLDLAKWSKNEMSDKEFCGRVGEIIFSLAVLGANFKKEKEVAEFKKDNEKYETEYAVKQLMADVSYVVSELEEDNEKESGARIQLSGLWKQESKSGKAYYSGSLGPSVQLQLWPNKFKEEGDKGPDLILYLVKR